MAYIMRVLLLTDSLSLPRAYPGGLVRWEEIYVSLLRNAMPEHEFIHVGIGAATVTELLRLQNYYALTMPDIVILHCGIVDCTPRALGAFELEIVKRLRMYRLVKPFVKWLRKVRGITYTRPENFEKDLLAIRQKFNGMPFVAVGILPGCEEYENVVPGVMKKIGQYNKVLRAHTLFVDTSDFPQSAITPDFHHLNVEGHALLFEKLHSTLRGIIEHTPRQVVNGSQDYSLSQ